MKIKVKFFAYFRNTFGAKEKDLEFPEGAAVRQLFSQISDTLERRREIFSSNELKSHVVVLRNGLPLPTASGLDTPLVEGDTLAIFPIVGGG